MTARTYDYLRTTSFPDNATGEVSPADVRDFVDTVEAEIAELVTLATEQHLTGPKHIDGTASATNALVMDAATTQRAEIAVTDAFTVTISNLDAWETVEIAVLQDATGGRALSSLTVNGLAVAPVGTQRTAADQADVLTVRRYPSLTLAAWTFGE